MALLKIIPTFNLEVAKEFGKVLVSNAYDLTEAEIKELKKQSFTTDSEEHREWEKYMKDIQTAWNNYTHQE